MKVTHYSRDRDFKVKPISIKNEGKLPIKPGGGIWGSPTESEEGWRNWCLSEKYDMKSETEVIMEVDTSKFITIDKSSDLNKLPWYKLGFVDLEAIDFEKLVKDGVEGIHLTDRGQWNTRLTHPRSLYGWDCETVLILNEKAIKNYETKPPGKH